MVGTYRVATINGQAPPQVVSRGGTRTVELLDATLVVAADGRYRLASDLRITVDGATAAQALTEEGTWRAQGDAVVFEAGAARVLGGGTARFSGGHTLTLTDAGGTPPVTIVLRR